MKIVLFNNMLYTLNLPSKVDGSFSLMNIPNSEEILANIEDKNNKWVLNTVGDYKIADGTGIHDSVVLENNRFYILVAPNTRKLIYVSDGYDETIQAYQVPDNTQFVVGKNSDNQLCYKSEFVQGQHFALIRNNGVWAAKLAQGSSIYVNNNLLDRTDIRLDNGDILFVYGLTIIIANNVLLINNPGNSVMLNPNIFAKLTIEQPRAIYKEIKDVDYYNEDDYFFKTPRLRRFVETYELKFASPPGANEPEDLPILLVVGPQITMGLVSVLMLVNMLTSGEQSTIKIIVRIVSIAAMLMSSLLWPNLIKKYNKKKNDEKEQKRLTKYRNYLEKKRKEMVSVGIDQSNILKENLIPLSDCYQIIFNKKRTLWERKISQRDFLTVRVGIGDIPIDMKIDFNEDEFSIEEDILRDEAHALVNNNNKLLNVPVGYTFYNKQATAIMGNVDKLPFFLNNVILQLVTFHSYDDLKIVIFTDEKNAYKWENYKNLPHCFSNDKSMRFFATNMDEVKAVSNFLEQAVIERANSSEEQMGENVAVENEDRENGLTFSPYYLIFTDNFSRIRKLGISELILKNKVNLGFGLVIVENYLGKLPSECINFITIGNQTSGILRNDLDDYYHQDFNDEIDRNIDMKRISEMLSNIPIEFFQDNHFLPKSIGFLEMQKVGKVEQLNSLNRWRLNDPTKSLRAAVGINDLGNIIYLDLHEKYHGPHGLIAGMTASGKSEFIITYVLSMALNYSPNEVSFILIDYKGGGLAGAFENKTQNIRLPHLAGTITNLDKAELNRTLVSIDSELRRRQAMFNEARDKLGESTIDIYKYQKFFRQKKLKEPVPHLFIISDEFAELKSQQPEFMDNLISTARIGRSLGVHLILATQKPTGVVNDQIWSNSKFRVCLKVQDRSDSNEMIKKPDAAEIKEAGRFYLQVGYDELFVRGQSGWAGTQYEPSDVINSKEDKSINYLNNIGESIKDYEIIDESNTKNVNVKGDELSNVLKYIATLARRENVYSPRLWLDNIPGDIYTDTIIKKYDYKSELRKIEAIVGEYDDPSNQKQGIIKINIGEGHTAVYGTSGTGREMFLNSLIYSACELHSSEEVNFYIFDFGSETLRLFERLPHVGDIVYATDDEKISKLMKMINEAIVKRKKMFSDYNGEYELYCKNSGSTVPRIVYVINNYDSFKELYGGYEEDLIRYMREGLRYGISFVISLAAVNSLATRIVRSVSNVYMLDMNNRDSYFMVLGKIGNVYPASYDGRGIFKIENDAFEFQTAQIYPKEQLVEFVRRRTDEILSTNSYKAESIPVLPDQVTIDLIVDEKASLKQFPIGIYKETLNIAYINFTTNNGFLYSANDSEQLYGFIIASALTGKAINDFMVDVLDADAEMDYLNDKVDNYLTNNFTDYFEKLMLDDNILPNSHLIIINNIDKIKSNLEDPKKINDYFDRINKLENYRIILAEPTYKLKKFIFDPWFSDTFVSSNGLWIGSGIADQGTIRLSELFKKYKARLSNEYGWLVRNSSGELVKLVTIGEDDNEE